MTTTSKPSPPEPQPGPDPREPDHPERDGPVYDHAQSQERATMDPLPPAREGDMPAAVEALRQRRHGHGPEHRADVASQQPVPSEHYFPPVEDDRVAQLKPGPPAPEDADEGDEE